MKKTGNNNINSRRYWDTIYKDDIKREAYLTNETIGHKSKRFEYSLKEIKNGEKVLDIGCGVGAFTKMIKTTYPNCTVHGIDISDAVIEANKASNDGCIYSQGYVGRLITDRDYDFVFSGEVLEHLDDPKSLFLDAYNALKPGGKFLVTTPVDDHIQSDEHVWYFNHDDVENLFMKCGFYQVRFIYLPHLEHMLVIMAIGIKK